MIKIAVASGKGGTGKTTLSTNLAKMLAEEELFRSIILADLDVEEPNSGLFVNGRLVKTDIKHKYIPDWLRDKCSLCGLCDKLCNFNSLLKFGNSVMVLQELCHSCYACTELCPENALPMKQQRIGELRHFDCGDFDFIESRLDIGQEQAVPLIARTFDFINDEFSHTAHDSIAILDSPPGTSCPVIEVTKNSDFVILVTEPTPFGLHDLRLAVDTMRETGRSYAVVINRHGIGNGDVEEYCRSEDIRIIGRLPNMRRIAEIYSQGRIIYREVPEFREELNRIADFLVNLKRNDR